MRVELPAALKPGQKFVFKIDWNYKISDRYELMAAVVVMNIFRKMAIICSQWHNGIPVFVFTAISRDGRITSSPVAENLLSHSEILKCR